MSRMMRFPKRGRGLLGASPTNASTMDSVDQALGIHDDPGRDASTLARVRRRVLETLANAEGPFITVSLREPEADPGWERVADGVERKLLSSAGGVESSWVRLAPGAVFPGHAHAGDEECVVLQGRLRIGADLWLQAGDYHLARGGTRHGEVASEGGALLFLRSAPVEVS